VKEAGEPLIVEKPKEGSSVTQSTVVNQVRLAPNIAEGELSQLQQDSQRDGAALVIQSQSRSPQASLQGPQALSTAAGAQSQSQAQLQEGLASPLQSGVPAATGSATKHAEPAQDEQKSAGLVHTDAVQGTEPAEHQQPAEDGQPGAESQPIEAVAEPTTDANEAQGANEEQNQ